MFLVAFTCAVASVSSASTFQCSDRTQVELAAVRPAVATATVSEALVAQTLRCQGFDSKGAGHLIATCRFVGGADVGCAMVAKGFATEVARKQRQYVLPSCAKRAALRG